VIEPFRFIIGRLGPDISGCTRRPYL